MKEDAQLTCPISYEDPDNQWEKIKGVIEERLPLKEVLWKISASSSTIINQLPLRFLPSSASLFKDTEHSFRWFLSSYVNIYIFTAESLDAYKSLKSAVKRWVEQQNSPKGTLGKIPWLILYVATSNYHSDVYNKVYQRLCNDFYLVKPGDRSVFMLLPPTSGNMNQTSVHFLTQVNECCNDLMFKLKDGIVASFQHRANLYDQDIRRLEMNRGAASYDFKQVFLVRESLALLYQMMQLSDMALGQYEELENLINAIPRQSLPDNEWPMVAPEPFKLDNKEKDISSSNNSNVSSNGSSNKEKEKDCMSDAIRNGDDIVSYSINLARMKILKNKLGFWELKRYIFSRQMFFLVILKRPVVFAHRALKFLAICTETLDERYRTATLIDYFLDDPSNPMIFPSKESLHAMLRLRQLDCWALSASIKLIRVCRDLIDRIFENDSSISPIATSSLSTKSNNGNHIYPSGNLLQSPPSWDQSSSNVSQTVQSLMSLEKNRGNSPGRFPITNSTIPPGVSSSNPTMTSSRSFNFSEHYGDLLTDQGNRSSNGDRSTVCKDAFPIISELLEFALARFQRLTSVIKHVRNYHPHLIAESMKPHIDPPAAEPESSTTKSTAVEDEETLFQFDDPHDPTRETIIGSDQNETSKTVKDQEQVKFCKAKNYFSLFYDQDKGTSSTELLQRELFDSRILQENNLEHALQYGLVSRIRSVSHFWAKLYFVDLNNPSGYPSEPMPLEDFVTLQAASLPKNQVEKGRILEVSIALFFYKSFYEMQNLSQRYRFSTSSKLKIVEILTCVEQHQILLLFVRNLLQQNSQLNALTSFTANSMTTNQSAKIEIPNELKLWLFQVFLHSAGRLENPIEYRTSLSLFTLYEYYNIYRKSNRFVKSTAENPNYRPCLSHAAAPIHTLIQSISWFERLMDYSSKHYFSLENKPIFIEARSMITLRNFSFGQLAEEDEGEGERDDQQSSPKRRCFIKGYELINEERYPATALQYVCDHNRFLLSIHLFSHFQFPVVADNISLIFKKIHSESFKNNFGILYSIPSAEEVNGVNPNTTFGINQPLPTPPNPATSGIGSYVNSNPGSYYDSFLESNPQHSSKNQSTNNGSSSPFATSPKSPSYYKEKFSSQDGNSSAFEKDQNNFFSLGKDELLFCPVGVSARGETEEEAEISMKYSHDSNHEVDDNSTVAGTEKIIIYPGDQELIFEFFPYTLGEYALDRFYLTINSSIILYNYPILNQLALNPQQIQRPLSYKDVPLNHEAIQTYFDEYPLIRIVEPENVIYPTIQSSILSPISQKDYCVVTFDINPNDKIEEFLMIFPSMETVEWIHRGKGVILETENYSLMPNNYYMSSGNTSARPESPSNYSNGTPVQPRSSLSRNLSPFADPPDAPERMSSIHHQSSFSTFYTSSTKKTRTTTGSFAMRSRGNTYDEVNGNKERFHLQILSFSEWKFYFIEDDTRDQNRDCEVEIASNKNNKEFKSLPVTFSSISSYASESVATISNISGKGKVMICIPFIPTVRSQNLCDPKDLLFRCTINFHLQLQVRRKLCKIPLQIFSQKTLFCGQLLTGQSSSTSISVVSPSPYLALSPTSSVNSSTPSPQVVTKSLITLQIELSNLFDYSLELIGYQVISSGEGGSSRSVSNPAELFTLQQGCDEIPCIQNASLLSTSKEKRSSGVVMDSGESFMCSLMGYCKDVNFLLQVRFYFVRGDALTDHDIYKDLVFSYDTSVKIKANKTFSNQFTYSLQQPIGNSPHTPSSLGDRNITSAYLGKIFIVEGLLTYHIVSKSSLLNIYYGDNMSADKDIKSISGRIFVNEIDRWWKVSVACNQHWLTVGMTIDVALINSEKVELKVGLKLIPLIVGKIPFPGLEVKSLQKLEKPEKIERQWIIYDEHVSEVEVLSSLFSPSSKKLRKSSPLIVYDETE